MVQQRREHLPADRDHPPPLRLALGARERPLRRVHDATVDEQLEERHARRQLHVLAHDAQLLQQQEHRAPALRERRRRGGVRPGRGRARVWRRGGVCRPGRVDVHRVLLLDGRQSPRPVVVVLRARAPVRIDEEVDDLAEEAHVVLHMVDDVNLIEDDARVEHIERRVVEDAREDDVLEELQPVRVVHLLLHARVVQRDRLVEVGGRAQKVAVVRLVRRELGVVCREMSGISEDDAIGRRGHTFEHAYNTDEVLVIQYMLIQSMVIHQDCHDQSVLRDKRRAYKDTHGSSASEYTARASRRGTRGPPPARERRSSP